MPLDLEGQSGGNRGLAIYNLDAWQYLDGYLTAPRYLSLWTIGQERVIHQQIAAVGFCAPVLR